jgi:pilus assembly protein Flp/PilA
VFLNRQIPPEIFIVERNNSMNYLKRILREEEGQDMVEYGLLAAFISIVAIAALQAIGPLVSAIYTSIQNALTPAA